MRMNNKMKLLYEKLNSNKTQKSIVLNDNLYKLLVPKFIKTKGAILLKSQKTRKMSKPDSFPDLTGYECFVNHIHIEDQFENVCTKKELFTQGFLFATKLAEELCLSFPQKPFWVILSVSKSGCIVRFHQLRNNEVKWLDDDLANYKTEAVMVIEIEGT